MSDHFKGLIKANESVLTCKETKYSFSVFYDYSKIYILDMSLNNVNLEKNTTEKRKKEKKTPTNTELINIGISCVPFLHSVDYIF